MIAAWDTFFFAERSTLPLRVFRTVFGVWLVTYYLRLYELLQLHYGANGLVRASELRATLEPLKPSVLVWLAGNETAFQLLFAATLAAALLFASGRAVRAAAFVTWALNLCWLNPFVAGNNSADGIVTIHTFLFLVAALAGHLDAGRATAPAWSVRLFQCQLVLLYFFSGWLKSGSDDWVRGQAIHYVFQQPAWTRVSFAFLDHPLVIGAVTYGTLFFELIVFPVLVWPRATRHLVLLGGVAFHVGIALLMKIFVFGEIMPIAYIAFLGADSPVIRWALGWAENTRAAVSRSLAPLRVSR